MSRTLVILEVSQKQGYIFARRQLKDNIRRSREIAFVTSDAFFREFPEHYDTEANLVYSGGGHTVLHFDGVTQEQAREKATAFVRAVTTAVLDRFPSMELFVRQTDYDENETPGQNLIRLSQELERKKAIRQASFYLHRFGMETGTPASRMPFAQIGDDENRKYGDWKWTASPDDMLQGVNENFLAVVHIDGNSMGTRVQSIYRDCADSWDKCVESLRLFSSEIDRHYNEAFFEMIDELLGVLEKKGWGNRWIPVRRVISAGDDVCFICVGNLGYDCAARFMENLEKKINAADGEKYTSCAGIAFIHQNYPFRKGYDLSEMLCVNAKRFAAACGGGFSAMDWHIEFGQMKDDLSTIRMDYETDDHARLELRPIAVTGNVPRERTYRYMTGLLRAFTDRKGALPRSKVKELRKTFKHGMVEGKYEIIRQSAQALFRAVPVDMRQDMSGFMLCEDGIRRNLFFDAIELMDHVMLWKEEAE